MAKSRRTEEQRSAEAAEHRRQRARLSARAVRDILIEKQASADAAASSAVDDKDHMYASVYAGAQYAHTNLAARVADVRTELESYTTDDTTVALAHITTIESLLASLYTTAFTDLVLDWTRFEEYVDFVSATTDDYDQMLDAAGGPRNQ